jgi:hypothetical protein
MIQVNKEKRNTFGVGTTDFITVITVQVSSETLDIEVLVRSIKKQKPLDATQLRVQTLNK